MNSRSGFQLFISRLSSYTTNARLKDMFSPFGIVTEARLVIDAQTKRPRGFGFVSFQSQLDAQKALKAMNNRIVDGRLVFVEIAKIADDADNIPPKI